MDFVLMNQHLDRFTSKTFLKWNRRFLVAGISRQMIFRDGMFPTMMTVFKAFSSLLFVLRLVELGQDYIGLD